MKVKVDLGDEIGVSIDLKDTKIVTVNPQGSTVKSKNINPIYTENLPDGSTLILPRVKALDSDGTTEIIAEYKPEQDGYVLECTPATTPPTISLAASDTSPDFGDTVTITATPSDFTPTQYTFWIENNGRSRLIAQQSSNSINYEVKDLYAASIRVEATDGSDKVYDDVDITISSYVLDTYTGGNAFVLYNVKQSYTGELLQVRRSSDNATNKFFKNINNELSEDSEDAGGNHLTTWAAGSELFIREIYDPNGDTAFQYTASSQPKIYDGSKIIRKHGIPAPEYDGTDDFMSTDTGGSAQPITYFVVAKLDDVYDSNVTSLVSGDNATTDRVQVFKNNNTLNLFAGSSVNSNIYSSELKLFTAIFDGANSELYLDGELIATGNAGNQSLGNNLEIGGQRGGLTLWKGNILGVIKYFSDQSANRVAIEELILNYYKSHEGFSV